MHRINSLEQLRRGIQSHLRRSSAGLQGEVSLTWTESGETVRIKLNDGDVRISTEQARETLTLSRRELTQLILGTHRSAEPPEIDGAAGGLLRKIFPYYFPVCELDHS